MSYSELFDAMFRLDQGKSLVENLLELPFDEMYEIDLNTGYFHSVYHIRGKYAVPVLEGGFETMFDHACAHLVHPDDVSRFRALLSFPDMAERLRTAPFPGTLREELRLKAIPGSWIWTRHLLVSGTEAGLPEGIARCYIFDIQRQRDRMERTSAAVPLTGVQYDEFTGLLVEKDFFALAQERLGQLQGPWCVIDIDVEHFRLFSDWFGVEKGQYLLLQIAQRVREAAEQCNGLAGYRGMDLFSLLIPYDRPMIDALYAQLQDCMKEMSGMDGFSPVFGICMIDGPDNQILELYNRATLTTEEILASRCTRIQVYDGALHRKIAAEYQLLNEFQHAIENGEVCFWLQPQCSMNSHLIVGAESLVRWRKPDGTWVPPAVFVPILEKYDLVTGMDRYIWESVCQWIRSWIDRGHAPVPVSVNVSRIDITSMDVPAHFAVLVERYRLPVSSIKIEITESAYVDDSNQVRKAVSRLRELGFMVLMDDFGSGYSSLNMLRNLNVDVIKLDAQFLHLNEGDGQKAVSILESIVAMTKNLSTPIIVEGVETREQEKFLTDLGCGYMQGFYFHRPMPVAEFEALVADDLQVDHQGIAFNANQELHVREFLDENIYSDAMLNNIIGPVAFYRLHGEHIDIIRYNEQFFRLVGIPLKDFNERICDIQDSLYPGDAEKMFEMMEQAERDRLNGAKGLVRAYRPNGVLVWLSVQLYYLGEDEQGKTFYGSDQDVTELQFISSDLPGAYFRCTADSQLAFLFVSENFLTMTGYTEKELAQQFNNRLTDMIHPKDLPQVLEQTELYRSGALVRYRPYRIRRKRGDYIYVADQSHLTDAFGTLCWQSVAIDVTEVMNTRNQMRILAKFFQGTILFLHRRAQGLEYEVAVHGLQALFGMDAAALQNALNSGALYPWIEDCRDLPHAEYVETFVQEVLEQPGFYTIHLPDGRVREFSAKADRVDDDKGDVEYIVTLRARSGQ